MPLYEGIALIQEKQAVVLDIGSEYTKFGLSGEAAPRCIIRSEFFCPRTRTTRRVMEYADDEELYYNLVHLLHRLFFRHVLVNPKERRVAVVQWCLTPHRVSLALARALYGHYGAAAVLWLSSAASASACLGGPAALSVSVGAEGVQVAAVLHGALLLHTVHSNDTGMRAVSQRLLQLLREDHPDLQPAECVLQDILVKSCFVCNVDRVSQWNAGTVKGGRSARYVSKHGILVVSPKCRELAAEVLFERDRERSALPDLILRCLMKCPVDARRQLSESILLWGGGAKLPGLRARLGQELEHLLQEPPYTTSVHVRTMKFHNAPCHSNYTAWLGAAILGSTDCWSRAVSRESWLRSRRVPDWSDTRDNLPVRHHFWRDRTPPPA